MEEAKVKIAQAEQLLQEANRILKDASDDDLRRLGLHWQYVLIACGDPRGGQGTKEIFNSWTSDRDRARAQIGAHNAQNYSTYYRNEMRQTLRAKKMPEPMIWERWPAISEAEKAERNDREDAWYTRHSRVRAVMISQSAEDPWTVFLRNKARKAAKQAGKSFQQVLQDKEFVAKTKSYYDSLEELDLGI